MLEWVVFIFDACSASRRRVHSLEPSRRQLIHEPVPFILLLSSHRCVTLLNGKLCLAEICKGFIDNDRSDNVGGDDTDDDTTNNNKH